MDTRRLFPILLIIFTNILGAGVILPILPLFAEGQFQGTIPQITLLSTTFFAAQFLAAPVLGRLSDRYGRRPVQLSRKSTISAPLTPVTRTIDEDRSPPPALRGPAPS